ncbi:YdcF family protein [Marinovum sp.]|uniref:YdcF family protein n=1 Tax=Marinovum sp. TaxID=2024839 RepID=UPI002B270A21|nr:YdcF family protein [Marinovum sp.]
MDDTVFFVLAKLAGLLIRPDAWLALLAGLTCAVVWAGRGRWLALSTALFTLLVGVFPLGDLVLARFEARYPAAPEVSAPTGILILGGGEDSRPARRWGGVQFNDAGERFTAAMALARRFPEARLVFTGGSGAVRDLATTSGLQAGLAEELMLSLGLAPERLTVETRSRNTTENARLTHALVRPEPGERWILVTSAFHMPRAMRSFERAGWPGLVPWPVDFRSQRLGDGIGWNLAENLDQLNIAMKETVGDLASRLAGK